MIRETLEKRDLLIGFIPIICAAPLLYAHRRGLFAKNGLNVDLIAAPGWSGVKELLVHERIDASHMLSPMPFACSLGIDGRRVPVKLLAIQNVNGQAVTLSMRHAAITRPSDLKGLTFGVPHRFSMQAYLLCHWLASHGVDPMNDVQIVEVAPPRMPYYVETGRVDGVLAPEPMNQRLVRSGKGFIFQLSRDIWQGHPCCSLAVTGRFFAAHPGTCRALVESVVEAELTLSRADAAARARIAQEITDAGHLNERDPKIVEEILEGSFEDRQGVRRTVPDRIGFSPYPFPEYGRWIVAQMQRWGQLRARVDYDRTVSEVIETRVVRELCEAAGIGPSVSRAGVEHMPALSLTDTFESMREAPFSAFREEAPRRASYDLGGAAAARLSEIVLRLAAVAGGLQQPEFEVTSDDAIGELECTLNELLLNLRFTKDAVLEQRDELERRVEQRTAELALIERQKAAILALSTPIIEVWRGVLALPIIGTLDEERAAAMTERLLEAVARTRSRFVIIDLTGAPEIDKAMADRLLASIRSVKLLGAEAAVSGIQPMVASTLSGIDIDLSGVLMTRTLHQAIERCIRRKETEPDPGVLPG